jgi:hypothetical protein
VRVGLGATRQETAIAVEALDDESPLGPPDWMVDGVLAALALGAAYGLLRLIRFSTRPPRRPSRVRERAPRGIWTRDPQGRWRSSIRSWWFRDR